jgi:hypothetical protein
MPAIASQLLNTQHNIKINTWFRKRFFFILFFLLFKGLLLKKLFMVCHSFKYAYYYLYLVRILVFHNRLL